MVTLLEICLVYLKNNMNTLLKLNFGSDILTTLDATLLQKVVDMFSSKDVETLVDVNDDIKSWLYFKLIESLILPEPETWKGNYSTLSTVYMCVDCRKLILPEISSRIDCVHNNTMVNRIGEIVWAHVQDPDWDLSQYIISIKKSLKSDWCKIYWRIWSECHYLYCIECHLYYSIYDYDQCYYHSGSVNFSSNDDVNNGGLIFPSGKYSCCGKITYKYHCISPSSIGCKKKQHTPFVEIGKTSDVMNIFEVHKSLIFNGLTSGNKLRRTNSSLFLINEKVEPKDGVHSNSGYENGNNEQDVELSCEAFKLFRNMSILRKRKGLIEKGLSSLQLLTERVERKQDNDINDDYFQEIPDDNDIDNTVVLPDSLQSLKFNREGNYFQQIRARTISFIKQSVKKQQKYRAVKTVKSSEVFKKQKSSSNLMRHEAIHYIYNTNNSKTEESNKNETLYNEGCCLPMQEVNIDDKYFNKPIQYTRRTNKHKKAKCGLQSNSWVNKFSSRFNKDKQREYEDYSFVYMNSLLGDKTDWGKALTDRKSLSNCLMSSPNEKGDGTKWHEILNFSNDVEIHSNVTGSSDSSSNSDSTSSSSYCSTLDSTTRISHSRSSLVWNSHSPLGGSYVRIETELRDALKNNITSDMHLTPNSHRTDNNSQDDEDDDYDENDDGDVYESDDGDEDECSNSNCNSSRHHKKTVRNIRPTTISSKIKLRGNFPESSNPRWNSGSRRNSFKPKSALYKNKSIMELPVKNCIEDCSYNRIWSYDSYSQELDYLSPTYMSIRNVLKPQYYKLFKVELQNRWKELFDLEKTWNAFLCLFFESESLPIKGNH